MIFYFQATRKFIESRDIEVDANNEDEAREIAEEKLSNGEYDDEKWRQDGIDEEYIENVDR